MPNQLIIMIIGIINYGDDIKYHVYMWTVNSHITMQVIPKAIIDWNAN